MNLALLSEKEKQNMAIRRIDSLAMLRLEQLSQGTLPAKITLQSLYEWAGKQPQYWRERNGRERVFRQRLQDHLRNHKGARL